MSGSKRKQVVTTPRVVDIPHYDVIALVLQGGGALGAYQAGVYEGLHEAGIRPTWLAGISIGALNAAIIAGSPVSQRVERLRAFWETICATPVDWPVNDGLSGNLPFALDVRPVHSTAAALRALFLGQSGFFKPRFPPPFLSPFSGDAATSFYDTTPLRETLERLVDFDRLNSGDMRVSVAAVNVRSGNLVYFDSAERRREARLEEAALAHQQGSRRRGDVMDRAQVHRERQALRQTFVHRPLDRAGADRFPEFA